jgi:translocation protein SEC63
VPCSCLTDICCAKKLSVVDEEPVAPVVDDGDISDPDEDTIAGQIAMLKGQRVKKTEDGDEEDGDEDEDESSDEETVDKRRNDSSDSDSDSEDELPRGKVAVDSDSDSD